MARSASWTPSRRGGSRWCSPTAPGDPARTRPREIEEQTPVGEVLVTGLIRTQLAPGRRLSLVVAAVSGSCRCCSRSCRVARARPARRLPLPWLLLGVLVYPAVLVIALALRAVGASATSGTSPSWSSAATG